MFRKYILPVLVWLFYRLLSASWRKKLYESPGLLDALENRRPIIFAHWHGDELAILYLTTRYKCATMTSTSKDGELVDFVFRRLGGATSRGSSTRGAVGALKGLVRLVKQGHPASMAVDGPKGPIHQVKPGVFELSRLTGAIIVPIGIAYGNPVVFEKSWNKAKLPKPFSKVASYFADPLPPITRSDDPKDPKWAKSLANALFDARNQASKLIVGS